ncbi:hypothetical protein H1R20_g13106, partial [Candolleomyces eurysporus]
MYKLIALAIVALITVLAGFSSATQIVYDDSLCAATRSLYTVSCSTGTNGLVTRGYSTLSSLPSFPTVGGFPGVGYNSTNCGGCYEVRYLPNGRAFNFTAVNDGGPTQAVLCTDEFLRLTGFTRENVPDNVQADIRAVPASGCGFTE